MVNHIYPLCSNSTSSQPNINHLYLIEIFYHIQPETLHISILYQNLITVKILKIGTPEKITIIVLQLEQLDFTVQYCLQKMQTE